MEDLYPETGSIEEGQGMFYIDPHLGPDAFTAKCEMGDFTFHVTTLGKEQAADRLSPIDYEASDQNPHQPGSKKFALQQLVNVAQDLPLLFEREGLRLIESGAVEEGQIPTSSLIRVALENVAKRWGYPGTEAYRNLKRF